MIITLYRVLEIFQFCFVQPFYRRGISNQLNLDIYKLLFNVKCNVLKQSQSLCKIFIFDGFTLYGILPSVFRMGRLMRSVEGT
jgi:hypothetical protein